MNDYFIKIYQWMLDLELPSHQLRVYAFIYTLQEMKIECFGQNYISESTRLSKSRVSEALKLLELKGLIEKEYQGQNRSMPVKYVARVPKNGIPKTGIPKTGTSSSEKRNSEFRKTELRVPKTGTPLIGNKRINEKYNEKTNKKSLVAHSRSLDVVAAETLISLSVPSYSELTESILGFIDNRKKLKKPLTERALILNIKKAHKLAEGVPGKMADLFNLAVERGWLGIYPEKNFTKGGKKNDTNDDEPFFK